MKLEFSAGGIIFRRVKQRVVLALVLDSYNQWTFPKGHIEKGEKPETAAEREASEETGLKNIKVVKLLDKIDYWFKLNHETYHKYVYFFLIEAPANAKIKPQKAEIKDARWFSPSQAKAILGYKKDSVPILEKAFNELKIMV
jgi:8-oxo-dGTP diphosphatase